MLAAAAVEWYRLKLFHEGKVLPAAGGNRSQSILSHRDGSGIVDMNVFWQVPQYLLVGLSEVRAHCHGLTRSQAAHEPLRCLCLFGDVSVLQCGQSYCSPYSSYCLLVSPDVVSHPDTLHDLSFVDCDQEAKPCHMHFLLLSCVSRWLTTCLCPCTLSYAVLPRQLMPVPYDKRYSMVSLDGINSQQAIWSPYTLVPRPPVLQSQLTNATGETQTPLFKSTGKLGCRCWHP